jgi:hypothetical protein
LVTAVCEQLTPPALDAVVQAAIEQLDKESEKQVEHVRLQPKRYRLDKADSSEPVYRLAPREHINELVLDIANNPLRIMVLSKAYFESQACLNELCLSLCAKHNGLENAKTNRLPMLIFADFKTELVVLTDGLFSFLDVTTPNETKQQTLLRALTATHKMLSETLSKQRGFDFSAGFRQTLPTILNELAERVYVSMTKDNVKAVATSLYRYVFSYLSGIDFGSHNRLIENLYKDWGEYHFAKALQTKINETDGNEIADDYFLAINNIELAKTYFTRVYEILAKDPILLRAEKS